MNFEVYRKRGKHWQYLGEYTALSSHGAALVAGYIHHIKVLGTRPANSRIGLIVHRFKYVPTPR